MNEMIAVYLEDFKESLVLFSEALMKAKKGEVGEGVVNPIFRVAHTLKGNSAGVEFYNIEKVVHIMEDTLQDIRDGKRQLDEDILQMLLSCHDFLDDSVDVIEKEENDKMIETTDILSKMEKIVEGKDVNMDDEKKVSVGINQNKLQSKNEEKEKTKSLPNMDTVLIGVLIDNCKRGHQVYRVTVELSPQCQMRNVKSWMVFQKIDTHATFVYSVPERIEEEAFKNGEFEFDGDVIEIYVMCDKDIDILKNDLMSISDIISVEVHIFDAKSLEEERVRIEGENEILYLIKDVEVNLLDMEKRQINNEILNDVEKAVSKIVDVGENILEKCILDIAKDISNLVKYFKNNEKYVENTDIEVIAFLIGKVEEMIGNSDLVKDSKLLEQIDDILRMTSNKFEGAKCKIGETLSESNVIKQDDVEDVLTKQREKYPDLKFGQVAVKENKASAYEMMQAMKEKSSSKDAVKENSFIRVPTGKVDGLMDMLGELLILNAQMEQKISVFEEEDNDVSNILSRSSKLIRGIQGLSMSLRMVQIKPTIHRLMRVARDTATELNKKVNVEIEGEETEIDRSAVEKLFDPLMHLVRNAVSHGIEEESDRINLGKSSEGNVTIRVYSKRGSVYVEVEDDGKGINIEGVRKKAKSLELLIEGKEYTQDELIRFIFHPGFSTQEQVNSISGRGVGMNVVEAEINKMGGKVDVSTLEGKGTIFTVRIPMNLAVVNGTVIEISGGRYIIPTLFIKEFCIPQKEKWVTMQGKKKGYKLRDNVIPVLMPSEVLGTSIRETNIQDKEMIILELEQKFLAFPVDKIASRQDIVSKPLDREFSKVGFASGASILGDGQVSVILDVEAMFKLGKHQ